jgi:hypothetical protein
MATKADRRAARERVSAYHESQLAGLLGHVGAEIDRYRTGEIDAYAADETIHHYHRAAAELWKFCFARGGGAHVGQSLGPGPLEARRTEFSVALSLSSGEGTAKLSSPER